MRMIGKRAVLGVALAGILALGAACTDDDGNGDDDLLDNTPSVGGALPTLAPENDEPEGTDAFVTTIQSQMGLIETRISEMEAEAATLDGDVREDAEGKIDELRGKVEDLQTKLVELDTASEDAADSLMSEIEEEVETILTEMDELADELAI